MPFELVTKSTTFRRLANSVAMIPIGRKNAPRQHFSIRMSGDIANVVGIDAGTACEIFVGTGEDRGSLLIRPSKSGKGYKAHHVNKGAASVNLNLPRSICQQYLPFTSSKELSFECAGDTLILDVKHLLMPAASPKATTAKPDAPAIPATNGRRSLSDILADCPA